MERRRYLAVLAGVAFAGCSDDDSPEADSTPAGTPSTTPTETAAAAAVAITDVSIDGSRVAVAADVPVVDGGYDAAVDVEIRDAGGETVARDAAEYSDEADSDTVEITHETSFEDALDPGEYTVAVTVEERGSGTDDSATATLAIEDPNAEERAAIEERLEAARGMIAEGVSAYRARGDGAMTGVTAEDAGVSLSAVVKAVLPVADELQAARQNDLAEEYADEIDRIEREAKLLRELVYAQRHAFDVVEAFRGVLERFDDESQGFDRFRQYEEQLSEFRDRIRGDSPGVVDMVPAATGDDREAADYRDKTDQFEAELETFERFEALAEEIQSAIDRLESARQRINVGEDSAEDDAEQAEAGFRAVAEDLADFDRLPSTAAEFESTVGELAETARDVRRDAVE